MKATPKSEAKLAVGNGKEVSLKDPRSDYGNI